MSGDTVQDSKLRGVDVDLDHLLTTYPYSSPVLLLHTLVTVVSNGIDTTTPLEIKTLNIPIVE